MKIAEGDVDFIQDIIDNESKIDVSLIFPGPPDDGFPPIACECGLKKFNLAKTTDKPIFVNMKYSGEQIDKLKNIMESESEMTLEITRLQGTFNFKEEPEANE